MKAAFAVAGLLFAGAGPARAAVIETPVVQVPAVPAAPLSAAAVSPTLSLNAAPAPLAPALPAAAALAAPSVLAAAPAAPAPAAGVEEPTAEDVAAAQTALILRNPNVPPRVARLIERELGLNADHPFFDDIRARGSQPRNSHTNEPIGEAYRPVNPNQVIVGLFDLRLNHRAFYDSLKNPKTGVVATGVRGGVDTMVEDLLDKGFLQPRSQGRNHRFLNGVYMDLPHYIHEVRKYAAVDPSRTEGKDRYPMVVAFRAANVHNPGSDYKGRIVGDGGTLGHVALDRVTPQDVVSIYVERSRLAQTAARLKGTPLEHAQVLPLDVLPKH